MSRRLLPGKDAFALGIRLTDCLAADQQRIADLEIMKQLGLQTLEFATLWGNVLPSGRGTKNQKGLDLYDRFVDELLELGITPRIELGSDELPEDLESKGGWTSRDSLFWFADYASLVSETLGDRVKDWLTHSDPEGKRLDESIRGWQSTYHSLLSHAYAREAMHSEHPEQSIGFGIRFWPVYPASDRSRDHEAALRFEAQHTRAYLDLLYKGVFNDIALQLAKASGTGDIEFFRETDKDRLKGSADYLRLDYAFLPVIDVEDKVSHTRSGRLAVKPAKKCEPYTHRRSSERLLESLHKLTRDYAPTALILASESTQREAEITFEGRTEDIPRMLYHSHHLQALAEAIDDKLPIKGYLWKSLRNTSEEYDGIIAIDADENFSLKDSAYWLKAVIDTRDPQWESGVDYKSMD